MPTGSSNILMKMALYIHTINIVSLAFLSVVRKRVQLRNHL